MRKFNILSIIFILLFSTLWSSQTSMMIKAEEKFSLNDVRLVDAEGTEIEADSFDVDSSLYLNFSWVSKGAATYSFPMPDNLSLIEIEEELVDGDQVIGEIVTEVDQLAISIDVEEEKTGEASLEIKVNQELFEANPVIDLSSLEDGKVYDFSDENEETPIEKPEKPEKTEKVTDEEEEVKTEDEKEPTKESDEEELVKSSNNSTKSKSNSSLQSTQNVTVALKRSDDRELWPNESYMATVEVHVSGDGVGLEDSYLLLEINHDMIEDITKSMDQPSRVKEMEFTRDEENNKTYLKIVFNPLQGGEDFSFDVPIRIDNSTATFPEGYETKITASFYEKDGTKITDAKDKDELKYKTRYRQHRVEKKVDDNPADGQPVFGGLWDEEAEKFSPASIITYSYNLDYTQSGTRYSNNFRAYDKVEIIDVLPEGAEFDEDLNPGWKVIDDGTKVKYTLDDGGSGRWFEDDFHDIELHLSYPDGKDGDKIKNEVEVVFHQKDREAISEKFGGYEEPDHKANDEINHYLTAYASGNAYKKAGSEYAFGTDEYEQFRQINDFIGAKREDHTWYYGYRNVYPGTIENFEIIDYKHKPEDSDEEVISLDDRLRFTKVYLTEQFEADNIKSVEKYIDENGTTETITSTDGIYDLGDNALGFRVVLKEIKETERVRFSADSVMDDYRNVRYDEENSENNQLYNTVHYAGEVDLGNDNIHEFNQENSQSFVLTKQDEKIRVNKSPNNNSKVFKTGEVISFHLRVYYKDLDLDREFTSFKIVDLLPLGLDPLEPDFQGSGTMNSIKRLQAAGVYNYDIVENYANSGRTAYVFEFNDISVRDLIDTYPQVGGNEQDPFFNIPVQFMVNRLSNVPTNRKNEMYVVYDGEQLNISEKSSEKKDHLDLRENGDREEIIPGSDRTYLYAEEQIVETHKYVRDSRIMDAWGLSTSVPVDVGLEYRLQLVNNTSDTIDEVMLYDKFPKEGDTYIAPNQEGVYGERKSDFANVLTGPVTVDHDGFVVYYSTVDPPKGDSEEYLKKEENWKTEADLDGNFADVQAIKIVLENGVVEKQSEVNAYVPMIASEYIDDEKAAVNTFAYSRDGGKRFDEASAVRNTVSIDTIDLTVDKEWLGGSENRPAVEIDLKRDDKTIETITLDGSEGWTYTWKDLPKTDNEGNEYKYDVVEKKMSTYEADYEGNVEDGFVITNKELVSVTGEKIWLDDDSKDRPKEITVELFANGESVAKEVVTEKTNWEYIFKDLQKYDEEGQKIEYTVKEKDLAKGYESNVEGTTITNLRVGKTEVSGEKTWLDDNDPERPTSITVNLLADGKKVADQEVTAAKDWKYSFTDLDKYDENGKEIEYTIEEVKVEGYETTVDGYDLTNIRTGTVDLTLEKEWKDDAGETAERPEDGIKVNILQNGEFYATYPITEEDGWKVVVEGLPKYDEEGKEYEYTINEFDVPGYAASFEDTKVTNVRQGEKEILVTKTWWDDQAEDRPGEIEFTLYRTATKDEEKVGERKKVDTFTISSEDNWHKTIPNLDRFNEDGLPYLYEVEEVEIPGYKTEIHGFEIVNTRVGKTEVSGEKTWLDGDSEDRPKEITVELLANGEKVDEQKVTAKSDWKYSFTNLDQYDEKGKEIDYTIDEVKVKGYETTIDGYNLTNLRKETLDLQVEKSWKDGGTLDRPKVIEVELYQNDELYKIYQVKEEEDWNRKISNLPAFDDQGVAYEYSLKEKAIPGYSSKLTGDVKEGFTITNIRTGETEVVVEKVWKGEAADSVTVNLLRNGEKVDTVEITEEKEWKHIFTDLPEFDAKGEKIEYTVEEKAIDGYQTSITCDEGNGFIITNTRSGKTEVSVEKIWDLHEKEAEAITVKLLANGEETQSVELSEKKDWKHTFKNLEAYDRNGKEITYTVEEVEIEGFEVEITGDAEKGFTITNTEIVEQFPLEPAKTEVSVEKRWKGKAADKVTIHLLADGKKVDEIVLSEKNDWIHTFTDLPVVQDLKDEKAIEYSVEEVELKGYKTEITGNAKEGFTVTNTFTSEDSIKPDESTGKEDSIEQDESTGQEDSTKEDESIDQIASTDKADVEDSKEVIKDDEETQKEGSRLPKTATQNFTFITLGIVLTLFGIGLYLLGNRRKA